MARHARRRLVGRAAERLRALVGAVHEGVLGELLRLEVGDHVRELDRHIADAGVRAVRLLDAGEHRVRVGGTAAGGLGRDRTDAVGDGGGELEVGVEVGQARSPLGAGWDGSVLTGAENLAPRSDG